MRTINFEPMHSFTIIHRLSRCCSVPYLMMIATVAMGQEAGSYNAKIISVLSASRDSLASVEADTPRWKRAIVALLESCATNNKWQSSRPRVPVAITLQDGEIRFKRERSFDAESKILSCDPANAFSLTTTQPREVSKILDFVAKLLDADSDESVIIEAIEAISTNAATLEVAWNNSKTDTFDIYIDPVTEESYKSLENLLLKWSGNLQGANDPSALFKGVSLSRCSVGPQQVKLSLSLNSDFMDRGINHILLSSYERRGEWWTNGILRVVRASSEGLVQIRKFDKTFVPLAVWQHISADGASGKKLEVVGSIKTEWKDSSNSGIFMLCCSQSDDILARFSTTASARGYWGQDPAIEEMETETIGLRLVGMVPGACSYIVVGYFSNTSSTIECGPVRVAESIAAKIKQDPTTNGAQKFNWYLPPRDQPIAN